MNPVQYLGSKVQLLPKILELHEAYARPGGSLDLFSGSSVVSQALALRGSIAAVDASPAARVMFTGMVCDRMHGKQLVPAGVPKALAWTKEEALERRLIQEEKADELIALYRRKHEEFQANYSQSRKWWDVQTENGTAWITALYGGHFFGLRQARELDAIREWITAANLGGTIYQTALLSTASRLVASAGKHFASVLNFHGPEITPFVKRRLLDDRRRSALDTFKKVLADIQGLGRLPKQKSCEFLELDLARPKFETLPKIGFVYADPPYTTDQYSRFYHLLDSIARDDFFALSMRGGTPAKGRYPMARLHSPFSSETTAPRVFDELFSAVSQLGAPFVFSYSAARAVGSRNRTVTLAQLERLLDQHFSDVKGFVDLDHAYRPLQPGGKMQASATETIVVALP